MTLLRFMFPLFIAAAEAFLTVAGTAQAGVSLSLISSNSPAAATGRTGNRLSGAPLFSADGRWVVFASSSSNLSTNGSAAARSEVYRRDLTSGVVEPISAGSAESPVPWAVSADGKTVLIQGAAAADAHPGGNLKSQFYLFSAGDTHPKLVTVTADGKPGDGESLAAVMTPDGKWVAFESQAENLTPDDDNPSTDIFLFNVSGGNLRRITLQPASVRRGSPSLIGISDNGRFLAYRLSVPLPSQQLTNVIKDTDIIVADLQLGTEVRLAAAFPDAIRGTSVDTAIATLAADGSSLVARITGALVQAPPGTTARGGVVWWDLVTGDFEVVDGNYRSVDLIPIVSGLSGPATSPDGRSVLLNYRPDGTGPVRIGIWRPETGLQSLTDLVLTVPPLGPPGEPIAPEEAFWGVDGQAIYFTAAILNNADSPRTLYRRLLSTGRTEVLIRDLNGEPLRIQSADPVLSPNGKWLAFLSGNSQLVPADLNNQPDIFLLNLIDGSVQPIAAPVPNLSTMAGDGLSTVGPNSTSIDGRRCVFTSTADNLVPNDHNHSADIFLRDRESGALRLISVDTNGVSGNGWSHSPVISANGKAVVFSSFASTLTPGANASYPQLYYHEVGTGLTRRITHRFDSDAAADRGGEGVVISADGRYGAYFSQSVALVPGAAGSLRGGVYLFDGWSGTNRLIRGGTAGSSQAILSADGSTLAILEGNGSVRRLYIYDVGTRTLIRSYLSPIVLAAVSSDGQLVAMADLREVRVFEPRSGTPATLLYSTAGTSASLSYSDLQFTDDDRNVLFAVKNPVTAVGPRQQIVLVPVSGGAPDIVSSPEGVSVGESVARQPSASADGRFVAFRSNARGLASDLTPGEHIFVRDRIAGRTYPVDPDAEFPGAFQKLSPDGRTLTLSTLAPLLTGDGNSGHDVYQAAILDESGSPDSDDDGLPDEWERRHFYSLRWGPGDDVDGDGLDNLTEFRQASSPVRPPTSMAYTILRTGAGATLQLTFKPKFDSTLRVYRTPILGTPWNRIETHLIPANADFSANYPLGLIDDVEFWRFDLE